MNNPAFKYVMFQTYSDGSKIWTLVFSPIVLVRVTAKTAKKFIAETGLKLNTESTIFEPTCKTEFYETANA